MVAAVTGPVLPEKTSTGSTSIDAISSWHDPHWRGLGVVVLGLGAAGFSAADTLVDLGAAVTVLSEGEHAEHQRILEVLGVGVQVADADSLAARIRSLRPALVIVSPGIPPTNPMIDAVREIGATIWGDLELAWRVRDRIAPADWIMVTGTNGKTTTAQLVESMLLAAGRRAVACGNIGLTALDAIRRPDGFDVLVVEASSFQLHWLANTANSPSPVASVCLNLQPDHLDWHGSAAAYRAAKARVYERTVVACVFNKADEATVQMVEDAEVVDGCRAIGFGLGSPGPSDLGLVDDILVDRAFLEQRRTHALELTTLDRLAAVGLGAPHLVADVLAAAALARAAGVPPEAVHDGVDLFEPGPHRIRTIASAGGVDWVDDSKATNEHAARASLAAFDDVVWIVGGLLKGTQLDELVAANARRLRAAVVIGVDRADVLSAFERHAPGVPVHEVVAAEDETVMEAAVRLAGAAAAPGTTVLLAPAAASMDQFVDYADRGQRFAAAVNAWIDAGGAADGDTAPHPDGHADETHDGVDDGPGIAGH